MGRVTVWEIGDKPKTFGVCQFNYETRLPASSFRLTCLIKVKSHAITDLSQALFWFDFNAKMWE